ncbi:HK97-gp10 family putative phage morphogenesis protein [Acinetobacter nosocomialis]|uniref:HK97-gp10 family putative phage morphogenesis protein n=1 Tax=Acinetobacter nosocomialis TaxID=106654 RepID=UPI001B82E0E7|nr:HK97-gp10 family putative phage morphogenesis protein [Acinetobacter nosocomialis]MBR7685911.1 HK97 gp10 family phage protein [Acinetobacter nosocomialis]MBR7700284.1 HK97 gp10 family phage protein [Acinetobacter nosocomialis]MBR7759132.1 HK97 gp10 family phage protein [Acinetobacter nosocomialis]MCE5995653.1 HK97 gp10 family phage protein [Acinetobacter nosocomialis]
MESFAIWSGEENVSRKLQQLADPKVTRRIARKAARKGINKVRDAARQNAQLIDDPETRANIAKNIKVAAGKVGNRDLIKMRVGVDGGASFAAALKFTSGGDTRHWRFVEFGTAFTPAVPFMRIAFFSKIDDVIETFAQVFSEELDKELATL